MTSTPELRATIVQSASELFMQQGYAATSIKQIAKASGCTTAALYYYFEGGKSHILHEVIRSQSLAEVFRIAVDDVATLEALFQRLGQALAARAPETLRRMNWMLLEYPQLQADDRAVLQAQVQAEQELLVAQIARFVPDDAQARTIAWIFFCAYLGYGQILRASGVATLAAPNPDDFAASLAALLGRPPLA